METIVVGVDDSDGARAALEFAAAEATLRKARLRIVTAWEVPPALYSGGFAPPLDGEALEAFRVRGEEVAETALATVKERWPSLDAAATAVEGQPAEVLLGQHDATMVVVGSRGHGGFASLLLGSVSQQVVHHASCPVVVVRAPTPADRS